MSLFGVFYPRGGGRYLNEIIYSISPIISELNQKKSYSSHSRSWKLEVSVASLLANQSNQSAVDCPLLTEKVTRNV